MDTPLSASSMTADVETVLSGQDTSPHGTRSMTLAHKKKKDVHVPEYMTPVDYIKTVPLRATVALERSRPTDCIIGARSFHRY